MTPSPGHALTNVCLAENGGDLVMGPEGVRDGDWSTIAQSIAGQGGNIAAVIVFPECSLVQIGYSAHGRAWQYDGSAWCDLEVSLRIDGSWQTIGHWHGEGWGQYDVHVMSDDNGGLGWDDVTGMKMYSGIWGWDVGSAFACHQEMAAWAIPEPATLLLATIGSFMLMRRRRG